ncbi:MAG: hypothetical protein HYZ33_01555, partial [Ignavibacteriales bacterium]|nr:hypothetical protein [Ignavibacteriales bacterium]
FSGYSYSTSGKSNNYFSEGLPKFGFEARWKIGKPAFGLLAKISGTKTHGTLGFGIYFGWEKN